MVDNVRHEKAEMVDPNEEAIVDSILEGLPESVEMAVIPPSKCKFYTLEDPNKSITIKPLTFEDEKVLSKTKQSQNIVNVLLERCISNISVPQLLIMDKIYLLLKIREVSFGDEIQSIDLCKNCHYENTLTFYISQLKVNSLPDDFEIPVSVDLPTLNKTAKVRYPRVSDEEHLLDSGRMFDNLWRFVEEIDGNSKKSIIHKVIQKLPAKDLNIILKTAFGTDYGIQTKGQYECDNCGELNSVEVSVTEDFFSPS